MKKRAVGPKRHFFFFFTPLSVSFFPAEELFNRSSLVF